MSMNLAYSQSVFEVARRSVQAGKPETLIESEIMNFGNPVAPQARHLWYLLNQVALDSRIERWYRDLLEQ